MNLAPAPRRLGATDLVIGPLGLGGAPLGELYETVPEADAAATLAAAWRSGVRLFDTAPWYGHGLSEHRFGTFLRQQPRDGFVVSTKVGRVYRAPRDPTRVDTAPWAGGLPFARRFDYGYDGVMRSYEDSLLRLSLPRVDMLIVHDLDRGYHGDAVGARLSELERGGWRALDALKRAGAIRAIGVGINEQDMIGRFLQGFDPDFFLVAMPYTLLDQTPLHDGTFAQCQRRGVGVVIGAPYASGILATGAVPGAKYSYAPAGDEVLDRVRRIDAVCAEFGVPLAAAALRFPFGHDSVAAVIPGAISAAQAAANARLIAAPVPAPLWQRLRELALLDPAAPLPR